MPHIIVIRKLHIKTIVKYHYTPVRMSKIPKNDDIKCWQRYRKIGNVMHIWWELIIGNFLEDKFTDSSYTTRSLIIWSTNHILKYLLHWFEKYFHTKPCIWIFIVDLFIYNYKKLEVNTVPFNRWINKEIGVNPRREFYSVI